MKDAILILYTLQCLEGGVSVPLKSSFNKKDVSIKKKNLISGKIYSSKQLKVEETILSNPFPYKVKIELNGVNIRSLTISPNLRDCLENVKPDYHKFLYHVAKDKSYIVICLCALTTNEIISRVNTFLETNLIRLLQ